jgi:hypothetical protein
MTLLARTAAIPREPVEAKGGVFRGEKHVHPGSRKRGEVKKMEVNTTKTKRRKILPRELRIKAYDRVIELRRLGLS